METGHLTPLLDMFKHTQVDRDIKLMAAQGALGLRPDEHRALLELLVGDADAEISRLAAASLSAAASHSAASVEAPEEDEAPDVEGRRQVDTPEAKGVVERLAAMNPAQRVARAMKGSREERAVLIRDPNKIVAAAVLSCPKLSEAEVEAIAKMTNVSDEILRIIANTRAWVKSYRVVASLTRNPKTPPALSMNLLSRLNERDTKLLVADRNVPDVVRLAARRKLSPKG